MSERIFNKINELLTAQNAKFRVIDHAPVRTSDEAAKVRGTTPEQGAKALVCVIKGVKNPPLNQNFNSLKNEASSTILKDNKCYVLAVLPGNLKADLSVITAKLGGTRASLASPAETAELADCVFGSVPPFSFHERLILVVDPKLFKNSEIAFNAGLLDRSMVLNTKDYERITKPLLINFAEEN